MDTAFSVLTSLAVTVSSLFGLTPDIQSLDQSDPQVLQAQTNYDWPQYQHDENRTGWNPEPSVPYGFSETWRKEFPGDGISSTAQPIIVNNSVYIGTERGVFYALQLNSSDPNGTQIWQRQLDGPVTHTAAATQQAVFVGTLFGSIYALNSSDGTVLWRLATNGSFDNAVLFVNNPDRLYLADRKGTVYAVDTVNGTELWHTDLGYPIFQSPTYGDGKIYIGAEDMRLYALDSSNGNIVWVSDQLFGRSFHDYAPVYADGKVWVNTSMAPYTRSKNDGDLLLQACVDASDTKNLADAYAATIEWLRLNPKSQTAYVFDATTGQAPYMPGVLYSMANSGAQPPPVYANGHLYTGFHAQGVPWWWIGGSLGAMGVVDINTGQIVERLPRSPGEFTLDETNNFSAAGDILIGARCQQMPSCVRIGDPQGGCGIYSNAIPRPFTADLCLPGAAPTYANNHIVYQTMNIVTAYSP